MTRPGVLSRYQGRIERGEIEPDPAQGEAARRLDVLSRDLTRWGGPPRGLLGRLRGSRGAAPRGLYVHGAVGRGKTMLMDLFFDATDFHPKQRSHFHEFMADVHDRIGRARKADPGDPIPIVAAEVAAEAQLLCFDELHVTDIADAMILGRLFKALFEREVVVVATSNSEPHDLYRHGLNRQLFLPFIDLIEARMEVLELKSAKDFRLDKLAGRQLYFSPADRAARQAMNDLWERLIGHHELMPVTLDVKGRKLAVPRAAMGVARFEFAELCDRPLGAVDYLQIAHHFHTVMIDDIPILTPDRRDVARRFINLVDMLYDNRVCLIASADAEPDALYTAGDGAILFQRTVSRLTEMRSEAYLDSRERRLEQVPIPGHNPSDAEPIED